ncbi:aminoglycoside phosphotransferase family protein [Streptomyces albipurpureus]|uniref:Aminoglycoside phosphotransferase family protein n=1 Tax=Streptomyces albipurpureus TaxID=2897419 RepID=A0ABT0V061_9ACTN|nr:aminoglycoside phosphotransferase family protein [Streptomyces sp. CWNU-1]MCM2394218.1 aminoglycoside phosphotransferase family protein [Streptomyces sp. CWNU-1]
MIEVPEALAELHQEHGGEAGRAFVAVLPERAAQFLERWDLRRTGDAMHGQTALALPVQRADGTPAVLKLQSLDEENAGEPAALRAWDGDGAVHLLEHDPDTNTLLLERLVSARPLSSLPDTREAVRVLAELLARLAARPAPPGMRGLGQITAGLLADAPDAAQRLRDGSERRLLLDCAAAVREVADGSGDRLLHWDLHYDNILAADREPWLAIDPKPLAGDPGFELMPALTNLFDPAETRWRFDLLTETLGLDRERARAWTLGRVLQNSLWHLADGGSGLEERELSIARTLLAR